MSETNENWDESNISWGDLKTAVLSPGEILGIVTAHYDQAGLSAMERLRKSPVDDTNQWPPALIQAIAMKLLLDVCSNLQTRVKELEERIP